MSIHGRRPWSQLPPLMYRRAVYPRDASTEFQIFKQCRLHGATDKTGNDGSDQQACEFSQDEEHEERECDTDCELPHDFIRIFEQLALKKKNDGRFYDFEHGRSLKK
jgi:hypothetical protein